jgi:hypothetical protein
MADNRWNNEHYRDKNQQPVDLLFHAGTAALRSVLQSL